MATFHAKETVCGQWRELTMRTLSVPRTVLRNRTILSNKGVDGPNSFAMVKGLRPPVTAFSDMAKMKSVRASLESESEQ